MSWLRRLLLLAALSTASFPGVTGMLGKEIRDVVGSAHWGSRYWFPSTLQWCLDSLGQVYLVTTPCTPDTTTPADELNEGANRLLAMGTRVIYLPLNPNPRAWYGYSNPPLQTTIFSHAPADRLRAIAESPPYASLFVKNFSTFLLAIGSNVPLCSDSPGHACECGSPGCVEQKQYFSHLGLSGYNWAPILDGMTASEKLAEKTAMKNLTAYLLANGSFVGKTFILIDLEGDWELRTGFIDDDSYRPSATRVQALRDWLNARQDGVNEARQANPYSGVQVYHAAEVNRVDWAIDGSHGATATNDVLPYTNCDVYSYSHWDSPSPHLPDVLTRHLDYIATKAPDSAHFGRSNVLLAEYGGGQNNDYCTPPYQCLPGQEGNAELQKEGIRRLTETALAWGCPFVTYWQLYDDLLRDGVAVPRTQRPTNVQVQGLWLVPPDGTEKPIYSYFRDLSMKGMLRIGLRTSGGYYVSADEAGGGDVHVGASQVLAWEEFTIIDRDGGSLVSGDSVNILTQDGHYTMARDNGGGRVEANSEHDEAWERFTILKQNGMGTIGVGDSIALRTGSGHYFVAEGGGGGSNLLNANRTAIGPWEVFTLVSISCPSAIAVSPDSGPSAGGTQVTLTGTCFSQGISVQFNGSPASNVNVIDATHLTATTPAMPPGSLVPISVNSQPSQLLFLSDFLDVPAGNVFHDDIETIFRKGVTAGCDVGNYCPTASVNRAQMAIFLLRAKLGSTYAPPPAQNIFSDVAAGPFAPWIEDLYNRGITAGCAANPLRYCPSDPITHAQMAVFLLRAKEGSSYQPPPATGTVFGDVPASHLLAAWIEELARRGITSGCGNGNYCPNNPVLRDQMAALLVRTFNLATQGPTLQAIDTPIQSNAQSWSSGEYTYDGDGDIVTVGAAAAPRDARLSNLRSVSSTTNRLSDAMYDTSGNQAARGATATHGGLSMSTSYRFDASNLETFVYTANDERIGLPRGRTGRGACVARTR